ncbi:glycosyltransferase [Planktothrix sp. FACHB-1355]|uniref:glycosyltransferase family 2 protein n=1 Tax=Planktothrix sp. FACHB-1355 TaxID=2692854 RepID=UPI00168A7CE5|nr:glycosyltransferase [Planktothrix sp. FACHB-1355]MBD3557358.1 glycosyltransferase [Planktothrix sp. FACHB-1355]
MKITALTVNYNTPDFLERLLFSFRKFYDLPFIVVDGSDEFNYSLISGFTNRFKVQIHHFPYNIHHGPGMAYAFKTIKSDQILLLDSDLIVLKPGFVEDLHSKIKPESYGIGDVQNVNEDGFNVSRGIKYLHPACALINREVALKFPLPILHGAPMIETMIAIWRQKMNILQHEPWVTNDFRNPDKIFIQHDWHGTVDRTGGYQVPKK